MVRGKDVDRDRQNCSSAVPRSIVDARSFRDLSPFASFAVSSAPRTRSWRVEERSRLILLLDPGCRDRRRTELA